MVLSAINMPERVLIFGASGGIGAALAHTLQSAGCEVTKISRTTHGLDITKEASIQSVLSRISGQFDMVLVATGALTSCLDKPEKTIKAIGGAELAGLFAVNAIGPALILKHCVALLPKDRRSVFAALSARVGSIGDNRLGGWYSYRASKAALNQLVHTASIELARTHKHAICVTVHPGTVATRFTSGFSSHEKLSSTDAASRILTALGGLTTPETGSFIDWKGNSVPW